METVLENGKLKVSLSTTGGTLTSVKDENDLEYLWQGDAAYWSGQAPILFPICGSIRDDQAKIGNDGAITRMPRHGLIRKKEFTLMEQSDAEAAYEICSDDAMKEAYPYDFRFVARYTLEEKTITVTYEVENTGDREMPFFVGGHPGFKCPIEEGQTYSDYYVMFHDGSKIHPDTLPTPVTENGLIDMTNRMASPLENNRLDLSHDLFHKDALIFDQLKERKVWLLSRNTIHGVELDFEQFPYLILWSSANDGDFIAMEPWMGLSTCDDEDDVFEHKRNVLIAASGEKISFSYKIRIL